MDASPPSAAGPASRPPASPSGGLSLALRRLAVAVAALAVALLAAAACVLSFDDMRDLAIAGQAEPRFAYLYPAAFDALLAVGLISVPLVRTARPLLRVQAGLILALLMAAAATITAATATGAIPDPRQAAIVVALLPWVMLSVGLWLLLILAKQAQAYWSDRDPSADAAEIVPFEADERPVTVADAPAVDRAEPPAPPVRLTPETRAETRVRPEPREEPAPSADAEPQAPTADAEPEASRADAEPDAEPEAERRGRPVRWGDLVRPHTGDVLVHPLPNSAPSAEPEARRDAPEDTPAEKHPDETTEPGGEAGPGEQPGQENGSAREETRGTEAEVDTQPLRRLSDVPDPAHGSEAADDEEIRQADRRPYGTAEEADEPMPADPPSGRMRSTPLPPD
ncbi:DUF2637 domain-containing protein [Microtetraspora niveoalba]|uniref:DUF2637 domain-containing protein n=1 Tax=Microtetraspora niveoalba TaxID=46175 RepID=UPI0008330046|nr:DUF2637 domain-containing protein [Microtetraspora niveoalba]